MTTLLIDLDNTLVDRVSAFRRWAAEFLSSNGLNLEHIDALVELDNDGLRRRPEFFEKASELLGLSLVGTIEDNYLSRYPLSFVLDYELAAVLGKRHALGWRVGVVTNGPPFQEAVIRAAGIDRLVDGWAVSEIEGHRKPDIRITERLLGELRTLDSEVVVIGDGVVDIELAHNLGVVSVWIHRGSDWDSSLKFSPTQIADSLLAAFSLVEKRPHHGRPNGTTF